ncbi:hypothetical protein FB451DRAFT_1415919 [Mycena latifolia]|nr:hypothetical protein FB451DRAFT_1415919 [Mycena latifolia]
MPSICRTLFLSLLGASAVHAWCGDNGGALIGWGSQAGADQTGIQTVFGFNASGPVDAAGNPIFSVVNGRPVDRGLAAYICGQVNPDSYPQTTFGPVVSVDSVVASTPLCLTASALEQANITVSLLPCVNSISATPVPTQAFQWIGTAYVHYGFAFVGNQSSVPLDPSTPTDYVPTLVNATNTTAAYLRLDYVPGGLPASTGKEMGLVLDLSDDD